MSPEGDAQRSSARRASMALDPNSFNVPSTRQRKLSAPSVPLQRNLFDIPENMSSDPNSFNVPSTRPVPLQRNLFDLPENTVRRRLSNYSDAVSRRFSNTIGLRTTPVPIAEIVTQGKVLCVQYMLDRMKRSNIIGQEIALQKLQSAANMAGLYGLRGVLPELLRFGQELERKHPERFMEVVRQESFTFILTTDEDIKRIFKAVARDLIRNDMNWRIIVSLYAMAGGLCADCVTLGHSDFLPNIAESMNDILEDGIAEWIAENGGWSSLLSANKPVEEDIDTRPGRYTTLLAVIVVIVNCIVLLIWFGKLVF